MTFEMKNFNTQCLENLVPISEFKLRNLLLNNLSALGD